MTAISNTSTPTKMLHIDITKENKDPEYAKSNVDDYCAASHDNNIKISSNDESEVVDEFNDSQLDDSIDLASMKKPHLEVKRKLDFKDEKSLIPEKRSKDRSISTSIENEETRDSGISDYTNFDFHQADKPKKISHQHTSEKSNDDDENSQISIPDEMSTCFSNFGHKENITNNDGVTTTYIFLNESFKILYDDWKNFLSVKDACKFTKHILRAMNTKDDGSYVEELSRRCIAADKPSFTPRGVNRRIPITPLEHMTIDKCLSYFCQKKLKLNKEATKKVTAKKNSFITEDINTCIKKNEKVK
ncbi:uncharacterized protein LOC131672850 [Phymastichus coffea]|uniref:uncharacterized protein LOC131672850 n=1 Tax=Phymastichus coffea TaxID=108790 RepID=UPI00273AA198|nr:uncharacterized protein LOC131672850 [Phymastichus coffea]